MELFEKNPRQDTNFPFLFLDINNKISIPPRQHFQELHWHDELQILYVMDGKVKVQTLQNSSLVGANMAIFINKRIVHKISEEQDSHYRCFIFPDTLVRFYLLSPMDLSVSTVTNNSDIVTQLIPSESKMYTIIRELDRVVFENGDILGKEYNISSLLVQFINILIETIEVPCQKSIISGENRLSMQAFLAFIHQYYREDISLKEIAAAGNVSVGYCGRLFKAILDTSPYDYLINYRIKKSIDLLADRRYTITQIATNVGFNNVSYFVKCFKSKMHITPNKYRKYLN